MPTYLTTEADEKLITQDGLYYIITEDSAPLTPVVLVTFNNAAPHALNWFPSRRKENGNVR